MAIRTSAADYSTVNRFEVIDHTDGGEEGRVFARFGVQVAVSVQDDGLTMRVFLSERTDDVDAARAVWHGRLGNDLERLNDQRP